MNHQDIVARIKASEPAESFTTADGILRFLLRVLAALPKAERGGLLRKDAGENIAFYAPAGCNVSISRVCYPGGELWKILTDAGPGGANGPAWNDDGTVEASRYIYAGAAVPDPAPVDPPSPGGVTLASLAADVQRLQADRDALAARVAEQAQQIEGFADRLFDLEQRPAPIPPPFELPELYVEGSTGRAFGHGHPVRLRVVKAGKA